MRFNKFLISIFLIVLLVLVFKGFYTLTITIHRNKIALPRSFSFSTDERQASSGKKLSILILGDSWVAGKKLDSFLSESLTEKNIQHQISSFGIPGATTKDIYIAFAEHSRSYRFQKPDCCILFAGINDIIQVMGSGFYSHHMTLICSTLIAHNIQPIIATIPPVDLKNAYKNKTIWGKGVLFIKRLFWHEFQADLISDYNSALRNRLIKDCLLNKVLMIRFDQVLLDKKMYKKKDIHLSSRGNSMFIKVLTDSIEGLYHP